MNTKTLFVLQDLETEFTLKSIILTITKSYYGIVSESIRLSINLISTTLRFQNTISGRGLLVGLGGSFFPFRELYLKSN